MSDSLEDRWKRLWQRYHAARMPHVVFKELIQAYSAPERFYHNLTHIENCIALLAQTRPLAVHPEEVELALWFHDVVYDTRRSDNEQRSAEWAKQVISQLGLSNEISEEVSRLILATRHAEEVTDADAQLLVDIDLAILGAEAESFWQYEENIRKEYAWVPEDLFRQKRTEILQGFLDRQFIYFRQQYRDLFEENARVNLRQAMARLSHMRKSSSYEDMT